ncbi:MAG: patatin-like phospholipase family protein [Bacteroidales bacterium]|nr:patatin-like phospholipase family protein [Bacteroidales bacterium]
MKTLALFILILFFVNTSFGQENTNSEPGKRPKVGLVLSGGGAKGYAYIGLLKVLHEINMPIDYIGGSSIGSIMGALYAIGYHPDSIEKIIRNEDWNKIISNRLDRKYIAFEEKVFGEKYLFSMPIKNYKIGIGNSLFGSLNVDLMLNRFFSPVYQITDFNELNTPFLCIGTDLITGKGIVLNKGSLARAIRASMAIPGYFPPMYHQGHYFIDGGVVNNYPAEQIKALGADIIIGGDVQSKLTTNIEDLNSITKILDHVIGYQRIDANIKGIELTDIYIRFKMDYGMMDFTEYDSIIAIGERISRQYYHELKTLADSLNSIEYSPPKELTTTPIDTILINNIELIGDESLKKKLANGFFTDEKNTKIALSDIEESMKYLSGTKSFNEINYKLVKDGDETNLNVYFKKAGQGSVSVGIHYDNDYKGNLLANLTLRNIWNTRAKFYTDVFIGQSPRIKSMLIINNGIKPGIGVELDFYSFDFSTYSNGVKTNNWEFDNYSASIFTPIVLENKTLFKLGVQYDYFRFDQDVLIDTTIATAGEFIEYGKVFVSLDIDNRDKHYFASRGIRFEFKAKYVTPIENMFTLEGSNNYYFYLKLDYNYKILNNLVFKPNTFAGYSIEDNIVMHKQLFGLGGQSRANFIDGLVPFTGLRFVEEFGQYSGLIRTHFQYNFLNNLYATAMYDMGIAESEVKNLTIDNLLYGYGLKLSYDSFIGPVEFSVMGSNKATGAIYYLSIGYPL